MAIDTSSSTSKLARLNLVCSLSAAVLMLLASMALGWRALAQDAQVKLELTPATIDLPAKGEAQTQLVLRNKSASALQNVKLDWFSSTEADIRADETKELSTLAANAETYWTLHLVQGVRGLVPGSVYLRVTYETTSEKSAPQVLYATLVVKSREADEISKVVEVVPNTASTQLNEQRPGHVFLIINNKSNVPIRLGQITTAGPGFISGTADVSKLPTNEQGSVQIEARDSTYVPVDIKVTDVVRPGKHLLVFQVPVEWGVGEHLRKANVIAQQQFEVGILGESELLTALGLPSFLILPGFLMIATFRMLNKRGGDSESILKNATNPSLWIGAITLSGVMAYVYPYGTKWKWLGGVSRNYLIGYGLGDIVRVWLASIFLGLLAWLLLKLAKFLWRYLLMPASTDKPARLLRKLHWQMLGISLYQLKLKASSKDMFLVERLRDQHETYWAAPYINIKWLEITDDELKRQQTDLKTRVATELDDGSARTLAQLIDEGEKKQVLTALWDKTSGFNGPHEFKSDEVLMGSLTKGVIAIQI